MSQAVPERRWWNSQEDSKQIIAHIYVDVGGLKFPEGMRLMNFPK